MFEEFKKFAMRGNVIDLAVGVVIGAAFGAIVTSLVKDVIMPPVGWAMGGIDFSNFFVTLKGPVPEAAYEIRFQSLFKEGRALSFPCDRDGRFDLEHGRRGLPVAPYRWLSDRHLVERDGEREALCIQVPARRAAQRSGCRSAPGRRSSRRRRR